MLAVLVRGGFFALVFVLWCCVPVNAQGLTTLYRFKGGTDGQNPQGALLQDRSGNLYGTTGSGGDLGCIGVFTGQGCGTVFELTPPETAGANWTKTTLYRFRGQGSGDGTSPTGSLIFGIDGALYGVTQYGGPNQNCPAGIQSGCGTVYRLAPPASPGGQWTETVLYSFHGTANPFDGGVPNDLVLDPSGVLYGTTSLAGTAFQMSPPSVPGGTWTFTTIYTFGQQGGTAPTSLVMDGNGGFYGVGVFGGTAGEGVVFDLQPPANAGAQWTEKVLHNFGIKGAHDGMNPTGVILGPGGSLIGATSNGGIYRFGMIFQLTPPPQPNDSWTESTVRSFRGGAGAFFPFTPVLDPTSGMLYGVSELGGNDLSIENGWGTIFALAAPAQPGSEWTETSFFPFNGNPGQHPAAPLILGNDGALYGTTLGSVSGRSPFGTVFVLQP